MFCARLVRVISGNVVRNKAISDISGRAYRSSDHKPCADWTKETGNSVAQSKHGRIIDRTPRIDGNFATAATFQSDKDVKEDNDGLDAKHLCFSGITEMHHPHLCTTLDNSHFTVYYNHITKTPCWVYEYLTPGQIKKTKASRKKSKFREDPNLSCRDRATLGDYRSSGYDRGHLAAAGNYRSSQEALNQTFLLSNILPQVGRGFNQDVWRHLEEGVRDIAAHSQCVHIYTGPLYVPRKNQGGARFVSYPVIGESRVAVPTHLFKTMLVVLYPGVRQRYNILSIIMPNKRIDDSCEVEDFIVPLFKLKELSGLNFFRFFENSHIYFYEILKEENDLNGLINILKSQRQSSIRSR